MVNGRGGSCVSASNTSSNVNSNNSSNSNINSNNSNNSNSNSNSNSNIGPVNNPPNGIKKKSAKPKNFHLRYLELCRSKNYPTVPDIKKKNYLVLDFYGDKLSMSDWVLVCEALQTDQSLERIGVRLRKLSSNIIENVDSESRARGFRSEPAIYTKFIFSRLAEALCNCVKNNRTLVNLELEALPLNEKYITQICQALSYNTNVKNVSFARSNIGDVGVETICNVIKCLVNVESLDLSSCKLTIDGASHITDLIKFQKIYRYSEGWQKSLRYSEFDPEAIPGLVKIILNNNTQIGDEGVKMITEVLKEDAWIKEIQMENCGLTDRGAKLIIACLELNQTIMNFNIRNNAGINPATLRSMGLQTDPDGGVYVKPDLANSNKKSSIPKLLEYISHLEEQFGTEKNLRKEVEALNVQLHEQILNYEKQLKGLNTTIALNNSNNNANNGNNNNNSNSSNNTNNHQNVSIPEGYVLVNQVSLEFLIKERNDLKRALITKKAIKSRPNIKSMKMKRTKSETVPNVLRPAKRISKCYSKSEHLMSSNVAEKDKKNDNNGTTHPATIFVEDNIGDTGKINIMNTGRNMQSNNDMKLPGTEITATNQMVGMEAFKVFINKKATSINNGNVNINNNNNNGDNLYNNNKDTTQNNRNLQNVAKLLFFGNQMEK